MSSDGILGPVGLGLDAAQRTATPKAPNGAVDDAALRAVAQKFEAAFLAEMLKHAGLENPSAGLGGDISGGHGERAFKSMLTREYADALSEQSSLGLAEHIYADLKQKVAST